MATNLERLAEAGVIAHTTGPYAEVVESLSDEEVEALLSIQRRFDEKAQSCGRAPKSENMAIFIHI